jgi:hypothetical protein
MMSRTRRRRRNKFLFMHDAAAAVKAVLCIIVPNKA